MATFTNLSITGATGDRTLSFTATGLTGVTSNAVTVTAGTATQLTITTQPSTTVQSGLAFPQQPVLQVRDGAGNPVSQAGVLVTATLATGAGTLGGALTATTNAAGVATFTNLSITGPTGDRTLGFAATGLTGVTSGTVTVAAGTATQLTITTQPSTTVQSGIAFPQQPGLQLRDGAGNPVSQSGVVVSATIASGGGTLGGTLTASTNAGGVATFTNLSITGATGDRTLSFTATGLTGVTSGTVTVAAGTASQLTLTTQPSATVQSGLAFLQQPALQLRDGAGNPVSQTGVVVTATLATGAGTLGGTLTATTSAAGVATFTNLSITGATGDRTLNFTAPGLTAATSGTVTVTAGTATQLTITTQPSATAQSGSALAQQPVLQVRDVSGNAVSQGGVVVTATIATGSGTLGGTLTATTNASGVATFTNLSITGATGDRTLRFTATGLTGVTSGTVTVAAGTATQLTITTQPSTAAQSGIAFPQQPVLQVRDASGNAVSQSGVVVTTAIASGGGTLGGTLTATTNASGIATFINVSITGLVGDRTLSFTATGLTTATSGTVTVAAGTASQLTLTTQPSATVQSGIAFLQQPVLQLRDGAGNPVSQTGVVVTATIATGAGTLGGTLTATTSAAGVATFTNLSITGATGDRTLSFTATGLTVATSGTVTVSPGTATQLAITTQPSGAAQSGIAFAQQPVLQVRDVSGNAVSQGGVVVTATIATGSGTLGGTLTATTSAAGVATFTNLSITGATGDRTLSFAATGLTGATSGTVTVSSGTATQLTITTQPSATAQSGIAFLQQPVLQLRDGSGNPSAQPGVVVTAAVASGSGSLGGTLTATTNASGVAAFADLVITGTTGDRTLSFTATGVTAATSGTVTVTAGTGAQLTVTTQPSASVQSGIAFPVQPAVQVRDGAGNAVSQAGVVVTAAIATGGGTLGGTLTASTNAGGVATFTNLSITGTIGARTLSFTATGLTPATSGTVTVTAGTAAQLTVTTQPSANVQSGIAFPVQPAVQVRDGAGNAVSQAGVVVTPAIATGGGTLGGTLTATTNASGVATFTNLSITGTAGPRTLSFAAAGLTGVTSGTVTVGAGAASQVVILTQPSGSAQSGLPFSQQPSVQLQDPSGNAVAQSGVSVTASIASGGGTLLGTTVVTTGAGGTAAFTDLAISGVVGTRTMQFGAAGLVPDTSNAIIVGPGPAAALGITAQPSNSAQSGVPFAQQPLVQVRDASGNPVAGAGRAVTAVLASGTGTLGGTTVVTTDAAGAATFSNLSITGATGSYTLRFESPPLASATSNSITLGAGVGSRLGITTQPSSTVQSGIVFAQQPVIQLQDQSGNPVGQAGVAVAAAILTGGGTLLGTVTVATDAAGVAGFADLAITGLIGTRRLIFAADGYQSATSGDISVTPGPAAQLAITTQPSTTAQSGVVLPQQPVIQLRDASGNSVPQSGVGVTTQLVLGSGTLGGTTTLATNVSGAAVFTNLSITGTAGQRTLGFSATGLAGATSGPIDLTAGPAASLSITTQPSASVQSGIAFPQQPVLQLRDGAGNAVSQASVVVTAALATGSPTLGGTLTASTNASGVATFANLAITGTIGARTLAFSATGLTGATSGTVTVTAGTASQLTLTTQPSATVQSGAVFPQQPVVQLRDGAGNAVSQGGVVVTAAIATGGGTLAGTPTAATSAAGVATFTNLTIGGTVGDRTLSFSAPSLTGATSGTVTVTAGVADTLRAASSLTLAGTVGQAASPAPTVIVVDAFGNPVQGRAVSFTSVQGSVSASSVNTAADGRATVTWTLGTTAGSQALTVSSGTLTGSPITFTATAAPGAASQLTLTTAPSASVQSGVAFPLQPVLQLRDASGNAVSQAGVVVTAALATGSPTLGGTLTATTNASGVATFTNLAITGVTGDRTLSFVAPSLTGVTSGTVTVGAGAASQLTLTTAPSASVQSGVAFPLQPVLQLRDASGNAVSQASVVVTAALATGSPTLGGTLTATTNASGVATFTNLAITGVTGDRTLSFAAPSLTGVTSGTVTVTAGAASQLTLTTAPSASVQSGVAFPQQPVLQLRDASGNAVSQAGVVVTAALATGSPTLGGTLTATTNASGVATFTNLAITGTTGDRTLSFVAPSLTGVTSGTVTVGAGAASQLTLTTAPSASVQSGVAFPQQPVLQLRDASSNAVSQLGVVVTAALATGSPTLGGTLTATTNASGVATFTNLAITGVTGDRTLSFVAPSLTGVTSGTVTVAAGAASQLTLTTAPSASVQSGVAFPLQPVLQLRDASGNAVSQASVVVTAALATGGATLGGTLTATTNASGVATFTNLAITGTIGDRTLSFVAPSLTGVTSGTVTVTAGAASQLTLTTAPSASVQSGIAFPQQPAVQLRDASNNAVSQLGVVVTAALATGSPTLGGTLTATTNASGVATFTNLAITGVTGDRTLSFVAPSLTGVTSGTVTVGAGAASQLTLTTAPSASVQSGVAFPLQPVLQLRDASGNAVSQVERGGDGGAGDWQPDAGWDADGDDECEWRGDVHQSRDHGDDWGSDALLRGAEPDGGDVGHGDGGGGRGEPAHPDDGALGQCPEWGGVPAAAGGPAARCE